MTKQAKLPGLLKSKIYKTGQTRGADNDEIFQNRVSRNSTVLIPFNVLSRSPDLLATPRIYENGYIVLISPREFFEENTSLDLIKRMSLRLGMNMLVFFEKRTDWTKYGKHRSKWTPAENRTPPLGGEFVARISGTTAVEDGNPINLGFSGEKKGAGIRLYEYAQKSTIEMCILQLESLYWLCEDSIEFAREAGMSEESAILRKDEVIRESQNQGLLDLDKLRQSRALSNDGRPTCPLCLEKLSSKGFMSRMKQAEGREVHDLTITQVNLFHINELRYGELNHRPYNLAWGHHHCNVVVKDSGINETLSWMKRVVRTNEQAGAYRYMQNSD
jgi:BstXI restriction endonuclease